MTGGARAVDGAELVSRDPRDGRELGRYPRHAPAEVAAAVTAARRAASWWSGLGHSGRRRRLDAWRRVLVRRVPELVRLISAETGKTTADAQLEAMLVADHLHWAAAHARRVLRPRRVPSGLLMYNHTATVEHHPLGVVGVIGPWNYPAFIPIGPIAHALAAGNTVVFKPSEHTPGVGAWLADTLAEAVDGPRVLEPVFGTGETGAALCSSGVDKVAFTGSTATGRKVMAACAEHLTPVLLECGGKDALLVDRDADLAAAAEAAVWGGLSNAGQTCVGVERVYVHEAVAEEFTARVVEGAAALRTGTGPDADIGPMTTPEQPGLVREHVRDALARGGRALLGAPEPGEGAPHDPASPGGSALLPPVVLTDVPEDARAMREETFGPVLVVNRVASMEEAVERANGCAYGLGAAVYSRRAGPRLARRLRAGMVSVNSVLAFTGVPALPFGGTGASGFGRVHGPEGMREFTRVQSVTRQRVRPLLQPLSFRRGPRTMGVLLRLIRTVRG
ncbi:aldehyde dehydrogenase family protein [Streptomyces sp. AJS327]|uniref:aldehyde dehydrogenase family protein n=1 Tax=Streptomyces sp. AJS327 TaxID=2545265 RepID=UPI0015DFB724|nr:aldehyde dehydrogenase family protein [Streptomyces sp. AJS327]MBA0050979.1 aldehyde dehydrogenase family protein [Streptomyces sp. AJS327]